jgi:transcriptional regulator of arginine metabolism
MTADTASRRRALRRMIEEGPISNQAELVTGLRAQGFDVTQATVSRDLGAMGVLKNGGHYRFRRSIHADTHLARTIGEYVESFAVSSNIVVLRTPPGAAQVVAAAIDGARLEGVLGTVAGDDTVLLVASEADGSALKERLEEMSDPR